MNIISDIETLVKLHNKIGLFVSGGFDSAVLSYIIHSIRSTLKTQNTIEFFAVNRYDDSIIHAKRIINFIDTKFNKVPTKLNIVGNPDLHHSKQVLSGLQESVVSYNFDIFLLGDTSNPSHLINGPERIKSTNSKIYQPFFNYTKDAIVQLCSDVGATELIDLTHTCTESKLLRCNECWQCKERAWAFKQSNIIDTGTM